MTSQITPAWRDFAGCSVLMPPEPIAVIHFLGGAFVAAAPHLTYSWLLERLASSGYAVIATPFINTLDHKSIAGEVLRSFERTCARLTLIDLPVYGLGHSMGCKLHLLIGSLFPVERAGNILVSYNNFSARNAIPLVDQLPPPLAFEFDPSPRRTNLIIEQRYRVRRNLLVRFTNDTLDQSQILAQQLESLFPAKLTTSVTLDGSHLTALGNHQLWQNAFGQVGQVFTPFDAVGQWFKQEVTREIRQLEGVVLRWLTQAA
ncbi:DUF1350 family protein [Leptolyngbya sp. FACHB-261]|uniref:DUF1350 family protein n=1 Tax=Leptolyngbya sp. FACHB-261 TaxID=2692806 RepID=UPI001685E19B|nr:DUF1350 family protein [Leptolyngbya sp. FACHB-261]MBD2105304.1 DUF1350 family protein [Leptolyngbya sp. FACHB-261]